MDRALLVVSHTVGRSGDSIRFIWFASPDDLATIHAMDHRITHGCGHEQDHYLTGFTGQEERKARWLATTPCRSCYMTSKRAKQADAVLRDGAALAHLELAPLTGSDRQVSWASAIRTSRLAQLIDQAAAEGRELDPALAAITAATWWIDHRTLGRGAGGQGADRLQRARHQLRHDRCLTRCFWLPQRRSCDRTRAATLLRAASLRP